jgi:hypothetical protein
MAVLSPTQAASNNNNNKRKRKEFGQQNDSHDVWFGLGLNLVLKKYH